MLQSIAKSLSYGNAVYVPLLSNQIEDILSLLHHRLNEAALPLLLQLQGITSALVRAHLFYNKLTVSAHTNNKILHYHKKKEKSYTKSHLPCTTCCTTKIVRYRILNVNPDF